MRDMLRQSPGLRRLVSAIARQLEDAPLLPPPQIVTLKTCLSRSTVALEFSLGGRLARVPFEGAHDARLDQAPVTIDVTGCLRANAESPLNQQGLADFREWAVNNPLHPLATAYLPLAAWLAAAQHDGRFRALARRFVRAERKRLTQQIVVVAHSLIEPHEPASGIPNVFRCGA
jgi:hypothetical protein